MESCSHSHSYNVIAIQHGVNGGTEGRAGRKSGAQRKKEKKEKKAEKRLARRRKGWPEGRGKGRQAPRPPVAKLARVTGHLISDRVVRRDRDVFGQKIC